MNAHVHLAQGIIKGRTLTGRYHALIHEARLAMAARKAPKIDHHR